MVPEMPIGRLADADADADLNLNHWNSSNITTISTTTTTTTKNAAIEESLKFWKSKLRSIEPCILPRSSTGISLNHSTASRTFQFARVDLDGIATELDAFLQTTGVALESVFKVAWAIILRTYTGSDHVCFGDGSFDRDRDVLGDRVEATDRASIDLSPCHVQFEDETSLLDIVRKAEADAAKAFSYEYVPVAEIQTELGFGSDALFNTSMIFWRSMTASDISILGVLPRATERSVLADYDITVHVAAGKCFLSFCDQFVSDDQASHLAGALSVAFTSIVESSNYAVTQVELFSSLDQQKLSEWNGVEPNSSEVLLHDLISEHCLLQPDASAVISWDGNFTYQELDCLSSSLARLLCAAGVGPDIFVTVCFDRCKWMAVAMLGIMKAGGAFCALDPSHPFDRLTEICQSLKSTIILTTVSNFQQAKGLGLQTIVLGDELRADDTSDDTYDRQLQRVPLSNVSNNNALYAVFTSGSTGKPKGIWLKHRSLSSSVLASLKPLDIQPQDRILHFASYAFDLSVFEIFAALTAGASLVIPSEEARMKDLPRAVKELQATWAFLTPSVARLYQPEDFPSLRTLTLGGEAINASDIERWGSKTLLMGYNPAECCPLGIFVPRDRSAPNMLGWSSPSQAAWIVDPRDQQKLIPVGAVGELIIEGPVVAEGYFHDITCSSPDSPFILSPPPWLSRFRTKPLQQGKRLYRTGDLVRYDCNNGSVQYVGRKDLQIKLRGQRMEVAEIELHLHRALLFPAGGVVVEVVNFANHSTAIIAFISTKQSSLDRAHVVRPLTVEDTDEAFEILIANASLKLRSTLPRYMIPTTYLHIGHIPLTNSGKVDRKQLKSFALSLPLENPNRFVSVYGHGEIPATDMERRLQSLFALALNLLPSQIGVDSDFFQLGGDSIQAMKLLALATQEGLHELTYLAIFKHSKLKDLASVLTFDIDHASSRYDSPGPAPFVLVQDPGKLRKVTSEQCHVPERDIEDIYPCTPLQASLITSTAHETGKYVALQTFTLSDNIDVDRLKEAWNIAGQSNPILRTHIIQNNESFYQAIINRPLSFFENASSEVPLLPSIGLGTPLIHLCLTEDRLFVAMHHGLYDGWSLPLLIADVDRAYCQLPLPPRPSFGLFVKYVAESMDSAESFWKAELQDANPVHFPALPFLNYKPEPQSSITRLINLPAPFQTQNDVTVATVLQLAWAVTCSTYTNSQDIIFGVISSGRGASVAGVEKMLGPTIASTPLRVFIDPTQEVGEALEEIQYRSAEHTRYEHVGLQTIVKQGENAAAACSFQTMLLVEPIQSNHSNGTWYSQHEFLSELTKFSSHSLTLRCHLFPGSVEVTAIFDPVVVPEVQMQRILSQYQHIFGHIHAVGSRKTVLGDITKLSPQDWNQLQTWNSALPPVTELCAHQMVQEICQKQPEALAICSWDGTLTYKELYYYAERVADHLLNVGIGPDTFVALYIEKSLWTVVAQLAVLIAGGAFATLETNLPINRLRDICRTVEPAVVLTSDTLRMAVTDLEVSAPCLVVHQLICQEPGSHNRPSEKRSMKASDPMYSVPTSGTTGKPKVVVIEHQAFLANVRPLVDRWGLTTESRVLQFSRYSFDAMILEHFVTLLAGGCICIPSTFDSENHLVKSINDMRINWAILTASAIQLIDPAAVPTLRILVQGGEPMHQGIIDRWVSHVQLFNAYGPAECSAVSTTSQMTNSNSMKPNNIGLATGGVCWIIDPEHPESPPVPIGAEGELIIEGPILARGYLGDPIQTALAFMPRPLWLNDFRGDGRKEARIYRTGDIVKHSSDASIIYLRRKDFQVKLRGQRLELLEVEHHVQSCFPDALQVVADIAVLPNTQSTILVALIASSTSNLSAWSSECATVDRMGTKGMGSCGFLQLLNEPKFLIDTHIADLELQERVPSYMVPTLFIPVSHFPRDPNGKVDRKEITRSLASLNQEDWNSYVSTANRIPPSNDTERKVLTIWADLLNITPDNISIHDSFFRLGGDSTTCMQVVAQCSEVGISITVRDIFKHRTIEKLAAAATATIIEDPDSSTKEVRTGNKSPLCSPEQLKEYVDRIRPQLGAGQVIEDIYPCSPIQKGILMSHARNPNFYEQAIQWKIVSKTSIDVDRLCRAWGQVVDRHAILRTVFLNVCEENYLDQVVLKSNSPTIIISNGEKTPEVSISASYTKLMHRLQVKRSNSGDITICLHINHALVDGHSLFIIKRDLVMAYEERLGSYPTPTPYRDYIAYLQNNNNQRQSEEYWKSYITSTMPCLFPRLKDPDSLDSSQPFGALSLQLVKTASLLQFCETHKLALSSVLHVIWAIVVQRYTAIEEVCFGYMTSGRHISLAGVDSIVGPLFNMLVSRVNLPNDVSVLSVMQEYQDGFLHSLNYQHQPFAETLQNTKFTSGELFNTLISIFSDVREKDPALMPHELSLVGDDVHSQSEYPITLNILMLTDQAHMMFSYHTSLLSDKYARLIAKAFRYVLAAVLGQPQLHLNEIEILDEEQRLSLYERNRTMVPLRDECIHHTIHERCLDSPNSQAVCAWDGEFSYRQLDQISSSLANELIAHGIGVEMTVPVLLEKSCWTPVAMVAVLKAGAAFLLMDASHPLKRLQNIYEHTNASLVLASSQTRSKAIELSYATHSVLEVSNRLLEEKQCKPHNSWQAVAVRGSNAAYMVFTSGSTGKPKGAMVDHSCLATAAEHLQSRVHMNSSSRVLQFSSHAWDIPVTDVLLTLRAGGCVCIPSDEERTGNLVQAANRMMANWALLTPTVARLVKPDDFTHLATLVLAGEPISSTDLNTWHDKVCLIQGYGPAECSLITTVSQPLTMSSNPRDIGQPNGCVAWIVHRDNHHLLAPAGEIGELLVEGPIVGRGYMNDPEQSSASFITAPSWLQKLRHADGSAPSRLYKTGDLVHSTLDGSLVFVGRKDNQVKIRGQRVELGEIEAAISRAFPGSHVIVELIKDSSPPSLAALILQEDVTQACNNSDLLHPPSGLFRQSVNAAISGLRESMASYMIPTVFLPLSYLPRAPTGKTDRKLLRDHIASLSRAELDAYTDVGTTRRTPSTPLEARLQEYAARVMHRAPNSIPLDEDLFTAGLDSLSAMTLATSAREDGLLIRMPTIFQHPRLSELALFLERSSRETQEQEMSVTLPLPNPLMASMDELCRQWKVDRRQAVNIVPATYFQRGSIAARHTQYIALHFSRPLSLTKFRADVVSMVQKHAILRTAFVPFQGRFVQIILRHFDLPVKEIVSHEDDPSSVVESICREFDKTPVSFGTPSTQLLMITGRSGGCFSAVLRLHRAQHDGVAISRIITDLRREFDETIPAQPLPLEHADFILARAVHNSPSVFQSWRELLHGSSMTYLVPPDKCIRSTDRSRTDLLVKAFCDVPMPDTKGGITMATVIKAAWALCLARQTQKKDVVFAQLVRNRHLAIAGIEHTVGPCINYIPVRVPLQPDWTAKELLDRVQRQHIQTLTCDTVDWDDLVIESTSWPHDTECGSAVHYLSAPVRGDYIFGEDVPCQLGIYEFKMMDTYPMVTCLPFPSADDSAIVLLRIILTSAVFDQGSADHLLSLLEKMIVRLTSHGETPVSDLLEQ